MLASDDRRVKSCYSRSSCGGYDKRQWYPSKQGHTTKSSTQNNIQHVQNMRYKKSMNFMAYGMRNSIGDLHYRTPSEHQQGTHGHNHITVLSGRGRHRAIDRRVHLAVDEIPERSDLVCIVTFAKLEAINNFEADRVYLCLKCREISIETVYLRKCGTWTQVFLGPSSISYTVNCRVDSVDD